MAAAWKAAWTLVLVVAPSTHALGLQSNASLTTAPATVDTMQLVLQYGAESYIPTSSASGTVGEGTAGFAKLSDATINSIDDGDAAYDYFKLTYDPQSNAVYDNRAGSEYDLGTIFVRTAQSSFNDVEKNMGWGYSYWFCSPWNANTLSECTEWLAPTTDGHFETNRVVSGYGNDCRRVFMDNLGDSTCFNPQSTTARCLTGNCASTSQGDWHGIRTNFKLYKFGALPQASGTGDPHLQNMLGERFDLLRPGKFLLIDIPRGRPVEDALLVVEADARQVGGDCADIYFAALNITGAWADMAQTGGLRFDAYTTRDEKPKWAKFGPVELKVAHGHTIQGTLYLNVYVKHLGRAGFAVGGLLGEDDHSEAVVPTDGCRKTLTLSRKGAGKVMPRPGSVAEAV